MEKHSVDELRKLVASVRNGTFHYEGRPRRSLDWAAYDEAQLNELADVLELIRRFVDIAARRLSPPQHSRKGRHPCPPSDVAKALLLQSYFSASNRVAAGLVRVFKEKLCISKEFSYKTIERGYDPSPASLILEEVFKLTNQYGNARENTFSVDGSGDPTSMKVNYESIRSEQRRDDDTGASARHGFQYTVSSVGVHTKIVAGFSSTDDHAVGELSMFPGVVSQTHINCASMDRVLGDALYSSRVACSIVAGYEARPYFFPRVNATFRSRGVPSWREMLYEFVGDPQGWLGVYHMRSISESVNSMVKRRFACKLRKRLAWRKRMEEFLRQNVHNIRQYSYLTYLQPRLVSPIPN